MDRDLEWEEYKKKVRQEIENIQKKSSDTAREKEVLKYLVTHPKSGVFDDLMHVNDNEVKGRALLRFRTGVLNDCLECDKLESCSIIDCLYCENSAYEIMLESGNGIKKGEMNIESDVYNHDMLFYDMVPTEEDLFLYLFDEESRYKIIRKTDNVEIVDTTPKIRTSSKIRRL